MRIAYLSDLNMFGKVDEQELNLRADISWMKTLDMFHYPLPLAVHKLDEIDQFDIVIINYPKEMPLERMEFIKYIVSMLSHAKVGLIQHGGHDHFMNWDVATQTMYLDTLQNSDFFVYTNKADEGKYRLLAPAIRLVYVPTDLDKNVVASLASNKSSNAVFIGGNMTPWYAGTYSLLVAKKFHMPITMPSMGRRQKDEEKLVPTLFDGDITYLPYLNWTEWINELSKHKYAVNMMPVAACGSFAVACAALGIPCIGRSHVTAQQVCFPKLCIDEEFNDIDKIVAYAQEHREEISKYAREQYEKYFERQVVKDYVYKQFMELLQ